MTIGEKLMQLNLSFQNLSHHSGEPVFTISMPAALDEISRFINGLHSRHSSLEIPCTNCLKAIEQALQEINTVLNEQPPAGFHKERRLRAIKEGIRKALLDVYDHCGFDKSNIAHLDA